MDTLDEEFAWVTPSGAHVRIADMPVRVLEKIATKHDVGWYSLLIAPVAHPVAALEVYAAACSQAGEAPGEVNTPRELLKLVESIPVDLPGDFEDGLPLSDTDEAETTTG